MRMVKVRRKDWWGVRNGASLLMVRIKRTTRVGIRTLDKVTWGLRGTRNGSR